MKPVNFNNHFYSYLIGSLLLASPLSSAYAALLTPDLALGAPGLVLMVDGQDSNVTVNIAALDGTFPIGRYDFGFVAGSSYNRITSTIGSYTFAGGTVVDFALRDQGSDNTFGTGDDVVYSISNPADYADQWYYTPIAASNSRNPVVNNPYYHTLALLWDLDRNGVVDAGFDIGVSTPLFGTDGVAPIPLPAAVWLLGSGLLGLVLVRRRRQGDRPASA